MPTMPGAGAILMVCTPENAPGVKEASVLNLSALSEDPPLAKDSASSKEEESKAADSDDAAPSTEAASSGEPPAAAAKTGKPAAADCATQEEGEDTLSALPQPRAAAARGAHLPLSTKKRCSASALQTPKRLPAKPLLVRLPGHYSRLSSLLAPYWSCSQANLVHMCMSCFVPCWQAAVAGSR